MGINITLIELFCTKNLDFDDTIISVLFPPEIDNIIICINAFKAVQTSDVYHMYVLRGEIISQIICF